MDSTLERAPRRLEMCRLRKLTAALNTPSTTSRADATIASLILIVVSVSAALIPEQARA